MKAKILWSIVWRGLAAGLFMIAIASLVAWNVLHRIHGTDTPAFIRQSLANPETALLLSLTLVSGIVIVAAYEACKWLDGRARRWWAERRNDRA